uniref:Uncharacterized protein n=1 Tax=Siphoviridae sp. ctOba29 TaxID=2825480 RepID=A0A8S5NVW7_9CAUD|nr:MAG TPA: hypothetical protein [Siphoviridae sp. ctOba29]
MYRATLPTLRAGATVPAYHYYLKIAPFGCLFIRAWRLFL